MFVDYKTFLFNKLKVLELMKKIGLDKKYFKGVQKQTDEITEI